LVGAAVLAVALAAEAASGLAMPDAAGDLAAGLSLLGGGAAMWLARPERQAGPLAALAGAAWFAGDLDASLLHLHRGPLVHLLLTYPGGRLRSPVAGSVVVAAYIDGAVPALARAEVPTIVLTAAAIAVALHRHAVATGVERRARAAALAATVAVCGALGLAAVARLAGSDGDAGALWAYELAVTLAGAGLAADLIWGRWARAAVTGLVVDLGAQREPGALRAALARALGDPALQVAFRTTKTSDILVAPALRTTNPSERFVAAGSGRDEAGRPARTGTSDVFVAAGGWVDEAGRPVTVPDDGGGRSVTVIEDAGAPLAALVHDPAALRDPALAGPVAAAARLAVATARLQADVAARVRDVAASRQRLVEAGDEERRRLGDALRAGPAQRLAAVRERLAAVGSAREGEARAALERLDAELARAGEDLARFARGVHPPALTEGGLGPALAELAEQAAAPVELDVAMRRLAPAQEAALYFACSEALTNVAKHAPGARARVSVRADAAHAVAIVEDDGPGGADAARGSGLRGLADRFDALGGSLRVETAAGRRGTRVIAALPVAADTGLIARGDAPAGGEVGARGDGRAGSGVGTRAEGGAA
jgi:signal transduction histidine kinase